MEQPSKGIKPICREVHRLVSGGMEREHYGKT